MGKLWMPMNNFKKVSEDQKSATLQHPDGHEITLAKNILSPSMLQQLADLPMYDKSAKPSKPNMARGGRVKKMDDGGGVDFGSQFGQSPQAPNLGIPGVDPGAQEPGFLAKLADAALHGGRAGGMNIPGLLSGPRGSGDEDQSAPSNPSLPKIGGGGGGGGGGGMPGGDPYSGGMKGMYGGMSPMQLANRGFNMGLGGAKQAMIAQQNGSQQAIDSINKYTNDQRTGLLDQNVDHLWNGWQAPDGRHVPGLLEGYQENANIKTDILTNKIDPNRWFNSGVLPKIVTALGLIGAMSNSKGSGEAVLNFVQGQMQNDIRAQMADKSGKMSVLQANLQQFGNMKDAVQMTGIQHQIALSALLEKAAQTTNNQMAKANYMMYASNIYNTASKQLYDWKLNQVLAMNPDSGAGFGTGSPQGGGGAQAGGCGPTDATGHPLPQGIPGVNGPMFQQYGPVNMPGGGTRFAGPNAPDANHALQNYSKLDQDLRKFQETQGHPSMPKIFGFETAGRKAKEDAAGDVRSDLRDLAGDKRLTPYQQQQIEEMGKSLDENPWIFGHGKNKQTIQDIGDRNSDVAGNALSQDLYGGYTRKQARKRWNPGG